MAQNNFIAGKITQVCIKDAGVWKDVQSAKGIEGGLPVFVVISESVYNSATQSFVRQYIPFNGFLAEGQILAKGQKVFADFIVDTFVNDEGFTTMSFKLTHIELDSDKTTYKPSNIIYGADLIKVDEDDEAIENDEVIEDDEVIENDTFECQLDDTDMYLGHFEYRRWEY